MVSGAAVGTRGVTETTRKVHEGKADDFRFSSVFGVAFDLMKA
ncbi:MAG: hypothetical protein AAF575_00255 [Bacteroidota bacterium]